MLQQCHNDTHFYTCTYTTYIPGLLWCDVHHIHSWLNALGVLYRPALRHFYTTQWRISSLSSSFAWIRPWWLDPQTGHPHECRRRQSFVCLMGSIWNLPVGRKGENVQWFVTHCSTNYTCILQARGKIQVSKGCFTWRNWLLDYLHQDLAAGPARHSQRGLLAGAIDVNKQ